MAKDLDPCNKANQSQKVKTGIKVAKELRSTPSGFSLKAESRPFAAAVAAEKHNPKVAGKEEECWDQGKCNGKEGYDSSK
jgi:hypothetical protein